MTTTRKTRTEEFDPRAVGAILAEWRAAARLSLDEAAERIRDAGEAVGLTASREMVRSYEFGAYSVKKVNLGYLIVASSVFGHRVRDLGPAVAKMTENLIEFMAPGQGKARNRYLAA